MNHTHNILKLVSIPIIIIFLLSFNTDKPKKIKRLGSKKIYKNIVENYLEYNTLSIKSKIKVKFHNKKYTLKANIRIKKDSIIWVNLTHASGIPVLRAILTPDSIKYLDKINKKYNNGTFGDIIKGFDDKLNYSILQRLLTNELIVISDNKKIKRAIATYKSSIDSNLYLLQNHRKRQIKRFHKKHKSNFFLLEKIYITPEIFKIKEIKIEDLVTKKNLFIEYEDFKNIDSTLFPTVVNFSFIDDTLSTNINIKYSKIKLNIKNKYKFRVPKSYERL